MSDEDPAAPNPVIECRLAAFCGRTSAPGVLSIQADWHDNYQTVVGWRAMHALPAGAWRIFQYVTLAFELGAPLWFALPWTRGPALPIGLGMHFMIGIMFGHVAWFALLMGGALMAW